MEKIEVNQENNDYGFYSKMLAKPFDSLAELKEAESKELAARKEKEEKAAEKKSEAKEVEDAYKTYTAAARKRDADISEAKKACAKVIADAKATYLKTVTAADEVVDKAYSDYNEALRNFQKKHPEGFHMTFKDGDTVTDIYHNVYSNIFDDFYDACMNIFKF